jgi:hypothetical protein
MVAANEGHSMDAREVTVELLARVSRFLEDALGDKAPSPIHESAALYDGARFRSPAR